MVSTLKTVLLLSGVLVIMQSRVLAELECYSCRGAECAEPADDQVETCDLASLLPTTTPAPDITTDTDMIFDSPSDDDAVQVMEYPLLENLEGSEESAQDSGLEIINSRLPGDGRFSFRKLKQMRDDDSIRCVYATYNDPDIEEVSTFRGCALFTQNNHNTCLNQVTGELITCYVCDTDRCNSAVKLTGAIFALLMTAILSIMNSF